MPGITDPTTTAGGRQARTAGSPGSRQSTVHTLTPHEVVTSGPGLSARLLSSPANLTHLTGPSPVALLVPGLHLELLLRDGLHGQDVHRPARPPAGPPQQADTEQGRHSDGQDEAREDKQHQQEKIKISQNYL